MDLARTIDAVVLQMHATDLLLQLLVANRPRGRRPVLGGVIRSRSAPHPGPLQHPADRLDSELLSLNDPVAVLIDIVDHHRDRHLTLYGSGVAVGYLILRSSSAAAKKAADVRSISFARRNSRFSRSNRARRSF